ncbi:MULTISPECIES: penicillin acylase family protein [unclassified Lysobacter]|uniref:penicillin acylase family protein n=1 Tax=unclassified Lysobacter TaxID=2635362 RepID=UPI0006F5E987|nr:MULTISPECIES: penicillin acylase family protein [unclassified Lysobacter]KRA70639.1 penicillin acylase [Lysobacter sp. Root667]KRC31583.1 penicillin acylase [Lysobacter sp. Root76]KRD65490.1 penicillin acylase [Lysobacter sp. Root96]
MAKWIKRGLLALGVVALLAVAGAWWLLRGSLPQLDGELSLQGLSAPVTVQRDAQGVVTIDAASEADAIRALGYIHAQERYFEMDLLRRTAAGELSALFGPIAVEVDQRRRMHRLRARTEQHLDSFAGEQRPLLQAYTDGVNDGLAALRARPWPYLLLGTEPARWQLADSALVGYAMYFDLQDADNLRERALWKLRPALPASLYALLTHDGSTWDAPLFGNARGDAQLPDAATLNLRALPAPGNETLTEAPRRNEVGSNNFAIAGTRTRDGRAIVADDMHLGLRAPNLWFRARLRYADPRVPGGRIDAGGFTLPGLPALVVGSNGRIAWGFTNSYGDWLDWAIAPGCAGAAPKACAGLRTYEERIEVKGEAARVLRVRETAWGPLMHDNADGSALALRWSAHLPGGLNLGLAKLVRAQSLDEAMRDAQSVAMPVQNLVVGDRTGRIGWRLLGPIPQRAPACTGAVPLAADAAAACPPWGVRTDVAPQLLDPPGGRLWTANSRTLERAELARIGDGGLVLGARAQQIRNDLMSKQRLDERDLLRIQLDDRAIFLARWWTLLRDQAARSKNSPALTELAAAAAHWEGRAVPESVSYRLVRSWRLAVHDRLIDGLTAPARARQGRDFEMPELPQFEGVAWPLVTQRPPHLLPRRYPSWEALFEDAARQVRDDLAKQGPLSERRWGERNTAAICHPLSRALPDFAKPVLCMPADELPGDVAMPRVQRKDFGASERMVVAPGHEAEGIIHMPGGQSGHPLSPYWGAGHDDWVQGRASPFLPGATRYTLKFKPR